MRAKILLWDLMDTVVVDPFFTQVPAFFGMGLEELVAVKDPDAWPAFERNQIDEHTLYQRFFRDGRAFDGTALKAHMARHYAFVPGMEPLLQELHRAGYEMHALSNYPNWYGLIEERLRLSRYMSLSFMSCITGARKPEREAFAAVCRALNRPASDFIFIDDRRENVLAARAFGMESQHFRGDVDALRRALQPPGP